MSDKILVALPAFNEGKVIGKLISRIKEEGFNDILVIDDCSRDNTGFEAKNVGAKVLRHIVNRGAGAATATGLEFAKRNRYDYVVFLDSDGQHNPKDIRRLLRVSKKYDVVIGSRLIGKHLKKMPISRRVANSIGSIATFVFFGLLVNDSQSGFKVFNKKAINRINITFDRYEFCSEIIGEIHKKKLKFREVPIDVIYTNHSLTNKDSGQSIKNGFKMLVKFALRR